MSQRKEREYFDLKNARYLRTAEQSALAKRSQLSIGSRSKRWHSRCSEAGFRRKKNLKTAVAAASSALREVGGGGRGARASAKKKGNRGKKRRKIERMRIRGGYRRKSERIPAFETKGRYIYENEEESMKLEMEKAENLEEIA